MQMLEFNLFLIDYWYFSVPLFLSIILWFRSELNRGGPKVDCNQLTNLVNKKSACLLDVRPKSEFDPNESLSTTITLKPFAKNNLDTQEPIYPAPPVIKIVFIFISNCSLLKIYKEYYSF